MLFCPQVCTNCGCCRLCAGEPLPLVDKYILFGVVLASNCAQEAHINYVVAKANGASYAMGSVLHSRILSMEIRSIVLLAKLQPVVEHSSTVWHAADSTACKMIEAVMIRIVKQCLTLYMFETVHHNVPRMELCCRHLVQLHDSACFRLQRIPVYSLLAAMHASLWSRCRVQGEDKPPKCWEELEQAVNVAMYDADDEASYSMARSSASPEKHCMPCGIMPHCMPAWTASRRAPLARRCMMSPRTQSCWGCLVMPMGRRHASGLMCVQPEL
jgi:hypothetical protein